MHKETFTYHILPLKDKLFRFARRLLRSKQVAEDVVQEVLVKLWQYEGEIHNVDALSMRMTRNLSLDKLRSKHSRVIDLNSMPENTSAALNPLEKTDLSDQVAQVHSIITSLPELQKSVVQLRDIEGYSYKEIADILDVGMNVVKVNLFRARQKIRNEMVKKESYGN